MLSGPEIRNRIKAGEIVIDPFDESAIGPNSVNLRLADRLLVYSPLILDMARDNPTEEIRIPPGGYVLDPGKLYLASTIEYTETHGLVPCIEGRSSVARLGLTVHQTGGFGDCNFKGHWVLELSVVHPLRIYAGVAICQIAYFTIEGELQLYKGKYSDQRGPVASRLFREFDR